MKISEPLLYWFDHNKRRHLPWRQSGLPYHVWISEIMLQQTRVETVIPYFNRFIDRLPSIQDLATVDEDELLKLWEGLGYYSRARNLQKAAKIIVKDHGGDLPNNAEELKKLPGIGPYTAGAIASIAFNRQEIAADGNAYRVAARLLAYEGYLEDLATKRTLEAFLRDQIPAHRPGDFNQALMDLGSSVCLSKGEPICQLCPLADQCLAHQKGIQSTLPRRKPKKARRIEEKTVLVFQDKGNYLLAKRPTTSLLASMWSFPMLDGQLSKDELRDALGIEKDVYIEDLGAAKHVFSHIEWHMEGYLISLESGKETVLPNLTREKVEGYDAESAHVWTSYQDIISKYSIPTAYRHYLGEIGKET